MTSFGEWDGAGAPGGPPWRAFFASWARLEPRRGAYDAQALARCKQALHAARRVGTEPVVVAHAGALPDWQIARGGWLDPDAEAAWGCYVDRLGTELGDAVRAWVALWCPLEEAAFYDGDARRVARVLLDAQAVAHLHLRRGPGHAGATAQVGVVERWNGVRRRVVAGAFTRVLATGRLGLPFAPFGELSDGAPAADFIGIEAQDFAATAARVWEHRRPILAVGASAAEVAAAETLGVRVLGRL